MKRDLERLNNEKIQTATRRHFLKACPLGLAGVYLSNQLAEPAEAGSAKSVDEIPRQTHHHAKAKNVIYIHLAGSPPNLDLFDYKPELVKRDGEDCPAEFTKGKNFAFTSGTPKLMGTPRKFCLLYTSDAADE